MTSADPPALSSSRQQRAADLRALFQTLSFSWLVSGLLRGLSGVILNALPQHDLNRLIGLELGRGWFTPSFLITSLVAGLGVMILAWMLTRWLDGRSLLNAVICFGVPLLAFWLVLGLYEIITLTRFRGVIRGGLRLSPAHLWILALALLGGLAAFAFWSRERNPGKSARWLLGAGLLCALVVGLGGPALAGRSGDGGTKRPNILLITVDTLRADHLGSYGYDRPTSPHLDALAARGILYSRSISQAPHTHPSMASMLTSAYPTALGGDLKYIPYDLPTVAEVFQNAGYRTAAVSSNAWIKRALGFDQGFAHFDQTSAMSEFYADNTRISWKDAAHVSDAGILWLDEQVPDEHGPFFLWLHYLDPHHPYDPQQPYDRTFARPDRNRPPVVEELNRLPTGEQTQRLVKLAEQGDAAAHLSFDAIRELYDGEIAYTDEQIGRVLEHLQTLGLSDRTAIAFTADHGEEFLDHDHWGHSHTLYDELIRVPLILSYPGMEQRGIVRDNLVRTLDVAPTLIDIAGLPIPKSMRGRSLLLLERRRPPTDPPAVSVLTSRRQLSVEVDGWKLIYSPRDGTAQLYDLRNDPGEKQDLAAAEPQRRELLIVALEETLGTLPRWAGTEVREHMLDQATRDQLKALGYVQ